MSFSKDVIAVQDHQGYGLSEIDAKTISSAKRRFRLDRSNYFSVQLVLRSQTGSGSFSVWYVKQSIDGVNFVDMSPAVALTMTTSGVKKDMDVLGTVWVEVGLTTASTYTTELVDMIAVRINND